MGHTLRVSEELDSFLPVFSGIIQKLGSAIRKHPDFPNEGTTGISIISEEFLEARQAFTKIENQMLNLVRHWNDIDLEHYMLELHHISVTIAREIKRLQDERRGKDCILVIGGHSSAKFKLDEIYEMMKSVEVIEPNAYFGSERDKRQLRKDLAIQQQMSKEGLRKSKELSKSLQHMPYFNHMRQ